MKTSGFVSPAKYEFFPKGSDVATAAELWRSRDIGLKCDVLGLADGRGVWVHWNDGSGGTGYVEEVFDSSAGAPERACALRWFSTPTGPKCKAMRLRFAASRKAAGGQSSSPPKHAGLLQLYTATVTPPDLLASAVNRFKAAQCGASSTVGCLRGLLANASSQAQPAGWAASWAARASEVAASAQSEALAA